MLTFQILLFRVPVKGFKVNVCPTNVMLSKNYTTKPKVPA